MVDAQTMPVGYEPQEASTTIPTPDDWSGFSTYKTFVNATAGVSATADWTYRDVGALGQLVNRFAL